jgi:hypothetical protein
MRDIKSIKKLCSSIDTNRNDGRHKSESIYDHYLKNKVDNHYSMGSTTVQVPLPQQSQVQLIMPYDDMNNEMNKNDVDNDDDSTKKYRLSRQILKDYGDKNQLKRHHHYHYHQSMFIIN